MDYADRHYLEQRMMLIRRETLALGKFGMGSDYYLEHLAKLTGISRTTAERLERSKLQMKIGDE